MTSASCRFTLEGRTVVITGGAGLLGPEYGRTLQEAGANVVLADLDQSRLDAAVAALEPRSVAAFTVDVTNESSVAALMRETRERFGTIDALVNNAAIDPKLDRDGMVDLSSRFENYPLEAWNQSLAVDLTGMFLCAREVAPTMLAQGRGVIVNVSSTYGMVGPDQRLYDSESAGAARVFKPVAYSVTKSGVLGLTTYLATYWAGTGIRVNTLTLGGVHNKQSAEFVSRYSARTPMGRMARRDEYGGALQFLLSDASSYMTGSNLIVDGGWTAW